MKIALIGIGKMGKEIEILAKEQHHEVVLKIGRHNRHELTMANLSIADVAIEFTTPEGVLSNIELCLEANIPLVIGTTGWYEQLQEVKQMTLAKNGTILFSSNFSIGVQLFFQLNKKLALMMNKLSSYDLSISEIHHIHKKDKPSGTAISLANQTLEIIQRKKNWLLSNDLVPNDTNSLLIHSSREDEVIGIHRVDYESKIDKISISHEAKSRQGFAHGALASASWLIGKKGFYNMDDFMEDILFLSK